MNAYERFVFELSSFVHGIGCFIHRKRSLAALEATHGMWADDFDPPLDKGIANIVVLLRASGIETYESCEGGSGHAYPVPTVRFHGVHSEGFRALSVALQHGLHVSELRRLWSIIDGEPDGPTWELTFYVPNKLEVV